MMIVTYDIHTLYKHLKFNKCLYCFRLDGHHVVFGEVTSGMNVVKDIEKLGNDRGQTKKKIVITDCGELK